MTKDYVIDGNIALVGALPNPNGRGLDLVDTYLLQKLLKSLKDLGIPLDDDYQNAFVSGEITETVNERLDIVNMDNDAMFAAGLTPRDFLMVSLISNPDILCVVNVPHDAAGSYAGVGDSFNASVRLSPHNTSANWAKKIAESGAKIVFVTGQDGFNPQQVNNGNFISFEIDSQNKSFIMIDQGYLFELMQTPEFRETLLYKTLDEGAKANKGQLSNHYSGSINGGYKAQYLPPENPSTLES